jgi:hypothetical protein
MPGAILRVLRKTNYDFNSLPNSGTMDVTAVKGVNVSAYREANLVVRVHTYSVSGGNSTWTMAALVLLDCPTEEDPACEWTTPSAALLTLSFATADLPVGSAGAVAKIGTIATPFGGWLKLILRPTQSATKETNFKFTLSADLIVKS